LPEDGTYTIVAAACCGGFSSSSGRYSLVVEALPQNPPVLDQTTEIEIAGGQRSAFYEFRPEAMAYRVTATEIKSRGNVFLEFKTVSGNFANQLYVQADSELNRLDILVVSPGEPYWVILRRDSNMPNDEESDDFPAELTLIFEPYTIEPAPFGESISGVLDEDTTVKIYAVNIEDESLLRLSAEQLSGTTPLQFQILQAGGGFVASVGTDYIQTVEQDPIQLFGDGSYYLTVTRYIPDYSPETTEPSQFRVLLEPSQIETLQNDISQSGFTDEEVFERVYRYEGVAGQSVRITLRSLNEEYAPGLYIQPPVVDATQSAPGVTSSSGISGMISHEFVLPTTGVYLFRISNGYYEPNRVPTGEFEILVESLP
jgi:hypothetical protein